MKDEALKLALEAAYLAGFNASGEGYNGEYPFEHKGKNCTDDPIWCKDRDNELAAIKRALEQPVQPETDLCGSGAGCLYKVAMIEHLESEVERLKAAQPAPVQKRPQNCGTGYCSCVECVMEPAVPDAFGTREGEHPQYVQGWNDCRAETLKMRKP